MIQGNMILILNCKLGYIFKKLILVVDNYEI